MANLYIAEDGTIHDRDTGNCQCVVPDDGAAHTVEHTLPAVIIAGALLCAIIYGAKFAARRSYNLGTYFMSALSAAGGTVGVGLAMYCLAMVITVLLYVIAIAFVIAIIAAIVGGD